ncbi:MAG: glycoside hydrolase family 9 protein [Ginsengibacter sp.]
MNRSIQLYFIIVSVLIYSNAYPQKISGNISLNQIGYYPNTPKVAVVTGNVAGNDFYITTTNLRDTVYAGKLSEEKKSSYSSAITRIADFSSLKKKGSYVVVIPEAGNSYVFEINNYIHRQVAIASLKGFYYQRVSMPLEFVYAGKWHRSAGHPDTAVLIHPSAVAGLRTAGTKISTPGGWYDAGDYNKYIVNSGITMGTLLSAYEDFPKYFDTLKINIPESSDGIPDILNEVIYNLRWMLSMQDPYDGGVYNKCTNAAFDGMVMPAVTTLPRYVVQKGTAATLDFAAVTAQASRILKKYKTLLPGLADSCLTAAKKAWLWAKNNPALAYNQNAMNKLFEPQISTGGYGDNNFNDEWYWAATELFVSTSDKGCYETITKHVKDTLILPSWSQVAMLANYTLLRSKSKLTSSIQNDIQSIKSNLIQLADTYISRSANNAFQTIIGQSRRDFIWGSNAVAANQGIILINAYLLTKDVKYLQHALTNLDYLLGRNATGYCFLTGFGSKSTMHPHHRQSVSDGITEPVPGLLAGGPNPGMQDKCHYDFTEPETAYSDVDCSYASNEIAINWNAPFVYLANAIEALTTAVH